MTPKSTRPRPTVIPAEEEWPARPPQPRMLRKESRLVERLKRKKREADWSQVPEPEREWMTPTEDAA